MADSVDQLIDLVERAVLRGDTARASAVLRLLAIQHPTDQRVLALQRQYGMLPVVLAAPAPEATPAPAPVTEPIQALPVDEPLTERHPVTLRSQAYTSTAPVPIRRVWWPMFLIIGLASLAIVLLLLLRGAGLLPRLGGSAAVPTPLAQATPASQTALPTIPVASAIATLPLATAQQLPDATATTPPTATPLPTATPTVPIPTPTSRPALAYGSVVQVDGWNVSLVRPDHAVFLDGSIGASLPKGRFALVLVTVGNTGAAPAQLPGDLVVLEDSTGTRYTPVTGLSTIYLDTYGRGQVGDISSDDLIAPEAGNLSVPLLFDLPVTVRDVRILVGGAAVGWAIQP